MMKKTLIMMFATAMTVSILAGCSGNSSGTDTTEPASASPTTEVQAPVRTEELILKSGDKNIVGTMFLPPEEKASYPTVVMSHGFNSNSFLLEGYAESFAKEGYACYAYDFCGGSPSTKSDGDTKEMSVLTEAQNLSDVIDQLKSLDYVDADNLFLFGLSQGGFVSSYVAAQRPEDVKALVLFYPAFSLQKDCWDRHGSIDNVPEEETVMGVTLSSLYSKDAMSFDIYEVIGNYQGDVLICHGDKDSLVDISYSERAVDVYKNAELKVIQYGEHGFQGKTAKDATAATLDFLNAHTN